MAREQREHLASSFRRQIGRERSRRRPATRELLARQAARFIRRLAEGRQVILCSVDCLKQFKENPEAFMAGEIVHTNSNKRTKT